MWISRKSRFNVWHKWLKGLQINPEFNHKTNRYLIIRNKSIQTIDIVMSFGSEHNICFVFRPFLLYGITRIVLFFVHFSYYHSNWFASERGKQFVVFIFVSNTYVKNKIPIIVCLLQEIMEVLWWKCSRVWLKTWAFVSRTQSPLPAVETMNASTKWCGICSPTRRVLEWWRASARAWLSGPSSGPPNDLNSPETSYSSAGMAHIFSMYRSGICVNKFYPIITKHPSKILVLCLY